MRTIPMPAQVAANITDLYTRHKDLAEGDDDQRRALQTLINQQNCFDLGPEWGSKNAGGGRPKGKDAVACLRGGVLYAADVFNGSTRKPSVPDVLEESPGQEFMPEPPVNHLGHGQPDLPPQPPVDPPAKPPATDPDLRDRVSALEVAFAGLVREVGLAKGDASEAKAYMATVQKVLSGIDPSEFAKKGDPVTVSGKIPFFGTVTAHGTIDQ